VPASATSSEDYHIMNAAQQGLLSATIRPPGGPLGCEQPEHGRYAIWRPRAPSTTEPEPRSSVTTT